MILLAFFAWAGSAALVQVSPAGRRAVQAVGHATAGWLNATLITNVLTLAAVLAVVVGLGKLRMRDLGLAREGVVPGLAGAIALWVVWQASLLAAGLIETGAVRIGPRWTDFDAPLAIGMLLGMLFVGLSEEVWFRGVLLVQLTEKLAHLPGGRSGLALALSLATTSILFGAVHLWGGAGGSAGGVLLFHSLNGLIFGLLFLWSGNLWFVAGVHWLGNWGMGMPVFATALQPAYLLLCVKGVLVAALWFRARRASSAALRPAGAPAAIPAAPMLDVRSG